MLKIVEKYLNEITEYENNPRNNDEAVQYVANSIREFGFRVPIVIDKNSVIVAGHTRYKAAKQLEMQNVPCLIADDLTEEQIKAYRLADNKVAEMAGWDFIKLNEELESLTDFDMSDFGFAVLDEAITSIDDLFADAPEPKEKEPKKIQCPHCGEWFEQ